MILFLECIFLTKTKEPIIFVESKISFIHQSNKEISLPLLSSYDRKKVHSFVAEKHPDIITKSVGEGKERRLHLIKKEKKIDISIDIDGDDI